MDVSASGGARRPPSRRPRDPHDISAAPRPRNTRGCAGIPPRVVSQAHALSSKAARADLGGYTCRLPRAYTSHASPAGPEPERVRDAYRCCSKSCRLPSGKRESGAHLHCSGHESARCSNTASRSSGNARSPCSQQQRTVDIVVLDAALENLGTHSLFPNAERTTDDNELADVIRGMIRHQQNGTQVSLIAFPGRNRRRQIIHIARKRLHLLA